MAGKTRRLYHGTHPLLAPAIEMQGLEPSHGYVWLTASEKHAYGYGAWAAGLFIASGLEVPPVPWGASPLTHRVATIIEQAGGPHVGAVCVVDVPDNARLSYKAEYLPDLPWESPDYTRRACYRSSRPIPPDWVTEIRFFKIPELRMRSNVREMIRRAKLYETVMPRGSAAVEDVTPAGIRHAVYNPRRFACACLEGAPGGFPDDLRDGLARAVRTAERGLELAGERTRLGVVLLYSMLHLIGSSEDVQRVITKLDREGDLALPQDHRRLLDEALSRRGEGTTSDDPTIGCCWDAERLDGLHRNEDVDPSLLSTEPGREMARGGARMHVMSLAEMFEAYRDRLGTTATINGLNAIPIPGSDEIAVLHPTVR